jgi:hypothetical protein
VGIKGTKGGTEYKRLLRREERGLRLRAVSVYSSGVGSVL